ncbi:MAG TPA: ketol-acid reductoisomerase [Candidatus Deferrimicrobium sp.]|nr:ketol-acid reductoisomerase [Candidatus Deferrimicrobium sp.]
MKRKIRRTETIGVIGYGPQGRAVALNLRDSGYRVIIGLRPRSRTREIARKDGFKEICRIPEAVGYSDVVCFAFPDYIHGKVFERQIAAFLRPQTTLWFLQGLSVHFGFLNPPENCDVILIAPHAPGAAVRENYVSGRPFSGFYAVHQDATGKASRTALALAQGIGIPESRLIATSFADEAVGDLFGEQAVLCGGLAALIKNGFEVLVENGIPPENAYLEVAYQLDLIIDLVKRYGIEGMLKRISVTARYGSLRAGGKIIDNSVRERMQQIFRGIRVGRFAHSLKMLTGSDVARFDRECRRLSSPLLEKAARKFAALADAENLTKRTPRRRRLASRLKTRP